MADPLLLYLEVDQAYVADIDVMLIGGRLIDSYHLLHQP